MNIQRIIYWLATIGICGIMIYSAQMYFRNTAMVESFFEFFNYPTYIVIPLAILKICGVAMLLWRGIPWLTEWAYAGIFFDIVLAAAAHANAEPAQSVTFTLAAAVLLLVSYFFGKEVRPMYH